MVRNEPEYHLKVTHCLHYYQTRTCFGLGGTKIHEFLPISNLSYTFLGIFAFCQ